MKRLLAIALLAVSIGAQHREEVTVEVVEVPVYVPVRDLTRDAFQLFVNGKPHPIDYFDVVDLAEPESETAPEPEEAAPRDIRRRRLFLLIFDLVFSRPAQLARGRKAALELITNAPADDAFAVATHSNTKGVQFLVPFTTDREAVGLALANLRPSTADDPMRLRITDSERQAISGFMEGGNLDGGSRDRGEGLIEDPFTGGGDVMTELRKEPLRRMIQHQIEDFGGMAKRLAQLDGQKHIVVFSEGFNPYLVHDLQKDRPAMPPQSDPSLLERIENMYRDFQSADTFLHAIDIGGLRHTFDPLVNDALHMLSSGTGGEFVRNRNDLAAALDDLQHAHSYGYILGFRPRAPKRGYNRIEVKVKGLPRGTPARYRRGFSGTPPALSSIDGLRLADIVTNDIPQHGVATSLRRTEDGVILSVPASAWNGLKPNDRPEVLLYVFDGDVVVDSRNIRLNRGAEHFNIPLDLRKGQVVKVLVRAGEALGFSRLAVEELNP